MILIYMTDGNALASVDDGIECMYETVEKFFFTTRKKFNKVGCKYTALDVSSVEVKGKEEIEEILSKVLNIPYPSDWSNKRCARFGDIARTIVYTLGSNVKEK